MSNEKKKRLFGEGGLEYYTARANQLDLDVAAALRPILDEVFDEGYSTRDVENLLFWTVGDMCVTRRLNPELSEAKKPWSCCCAQGVTECPKHGQQPAERGLCPICSAVLGYCPQGQYCTKENCSYVS